ncbi:MAG TPA: YhjD/YihY/BrkB family envelope integrity protein [Micromonosporaceae bacterium]
MPSFHNGQPLRQRLEGSFPTRCLGALVAVQAIDRAMVLASQMFTALIPLLILASALAPRRDRDLVAEALIRRFELSGSAADAVRQVFASPNEGTIGVLSALLLLFSGISLTRRMQRMYLLAWRVEPRGGIRGSLSAATGLAVLLLEIVLLSLVGTLVRSLPFDWALGPLVSIMAGVVLWTSIPWLLLDRRVHWRRLLPAGALTGLCVSAYGVASTVYMPRLMESYSVRYGLFGVTLALVGWLLAIAFIVVTATVVAAEFDRAPEPWARRVRTRLGVEPAPDRPTGKVAAARSP